MRHELVTEEIEIDPMIRAAALGTAEQTAIELAGSSKIVHGYCQVEGRECGRHFGSVGGNLGRGAGTVTVQLSHFNIFSLRSEYGG